MMNIFVSFFVMINKTKQNIKKFILSLIHIIIKLTYVKKNNLLVYIGC